MAEQGDSGEKTEEPTPRRLNKAREDGNVGLSRDFVQLMSITTAYLALQVAAPYFWRDLKILFRLALSSTYEDQEMNGGHLRDSFIKVLFLLGPDMMIITAAAAVVGGLTGAIQTKFLWTMKPLKPKLSHLNIIQGLKRPFKITGLMNTAKSILKLAIIVPIAYIAFFDLFPQIANLMDVSFDQILPFTGFAIDYVFWRIFGPLLALAIFDLVWQKYNTKKKLKMSKQEVKDERKSVEGDEATKRKIIQQGLNRVRQRMLQAVPQADVVVTNPTHFAVALSYSMQKGSAPKVVAKGRGFMAQRIREIARQSGVPVVERKPLARALFKSVEIGQEIPYELYHAVAELLAYVFRIKGKTPQRTAQSTDSSSVNKGE